jgi:hypothetical protein
MSTKASFTRVKFSQGQASVGGGVMTLLRSHVTFNAVEIDGSQTSYYGGAIMIQDVSTLTIRDSSIHGCRNSLDSAILDYTGGCFYCTQRSHIVLTDSLVYDNRLEPRLLNRPPGDGPAGAFLYVAYCFVNISRVLFHHNDAQDGAGGVIAGQLMPGSIIDTSNFTYNTASWGSVFAFNDIPHADQGAVKVTNCSFTYNTADIIGAVWFIDTAQSPFSADQRPPPEAPFMANNTYYQNQGGSKADYDGIIHGAPTWLIPVAPEWGINDATSGKPMGQDGPWIHVYDPYKNPFQTRGVTQLVGTLSYVQGTSRSIILPGNQRTNIDPVITLGTASEELSRYGTISLPKLTITAQPGSKASYIVTMHMVPVAVNSEYSTRSIFTRSFNITIRECQAGENTTATSCDPCMPVRFVAHHRHPSYCAVVHENFHNIICQMTIGTVFPDFIIDNMS